MSSDLVFVSLRFLEGFVASKPSVSGVVRFRYTGGVRFFSPHLPSQTLSLSKKLLLRRNSVEQEARFFRRREFPVFVRKDRVSGLYFLSTMRIF